MASLTPLGNFLRTPLSESSECKARRSHVERISLRLYLLFVDFASALLGFAQVA